MDTLSKQERIMNFDKLLPFVISLIIGATAIKKIDTLQMWIWKSQAQLLYQARASKWGSPSIFKNYSSTQSSAKIKKLDNSY